MYIVTSKQYFAMIIGTKKVAIEAATQIIPLLNPIAVPLYLLGKARSGKPIEGVQPSRKHSINDKENEDKNK